MDDGLNALWIKLFLFSKTKIRARYIRLGVMRRISMAILRATAQHLLSGLDIIGPHSIYASEELRRQTSASEAEHDEYRGGAMAFDDSFARSHAGSA